MRSFVEKRRTAFFVEKSSIFLKKSLDISSASRYNNTRRQGRGPRRKEYADVAELADALDSGSSSLKRVWVQIPSSAPKKSTQERKFLGAFFLLYSTFYRTAYRSAISPTDFWTRFYSVVQPFLGGLPTLKPTFSATFWNLAGEWAIFLRKNRINPAVFRMFSISP